MSLRTGMWHGLQNDIIMRNVKYRKWRKEITILKSMRVFAAPFTGIQAMESYVMIHVMM